MQTPEQKAKEDAAWNALVSAARDWAGHMDQWDKFKFNTEFGVVYVTIGRQDPWPNDFVDVDLTESDNAKS